MIVRYRIFATFSLYDRRTTSLLWGGGMPVSSESILAAHVHIWRSSTSGRELITDRGKKVAKMRFQHLSYRWLSEIAFLPPFCPGLFLQNPKLGFTSRTQVIMSISIFNDFCCFIYHECQTYFRQPVGWYARDSNLRVAPVKWHAICNTCYIYYTSNRVPCDDLYLSGNQSDDIYVRVAYLRVASVKWHATNTHTHTHMYIIQQIACHLWYILVR